MGCSSRERRRRRKDWQEPGGGVGGVGVSDRGSRGDDPGHDCSGGGGGGDGEGGFRWQR